MESDPVGDLQAAARHESGHAVALAAVGRIPDQVVVQSVGDRWKGSTGTPGDLPSRDVVMVSIAGPLAQSAGPGPYTMPDGYQSDMRRVWDHAEKAAAELLAEGEVGEFDWPDRPRVVVEETLRALRVIEGNAGVVDRLASEIEKNHHLSGDRLEELLQGVRSPDDI